MIRLLTILSILALLACNRKTNTAISMTSATNETNTKSVDTSSSNKQSIQERNYKFGDTLTGSMFFRPEDESDSPISGSRSDSSSESPMTGKYILLDSLESNGVKVIASVLKWDAGFKLYLKAIAKPALITDKLSLSEHVKSGIGSESNSKQTSNSFNKNKQTDMSNPWSVVGAVTIAAIAFILLGLFLKYLYNKAKDKKKNGEDQ